MEALATKVDDVAIRRHIDLIAALAREVGETELLLDAKRKALADEMLDAWEAQIRPQAIYEAAGLTKQRMYQLLTMARERRATAAATEQARTARGGGSR